MALTTYMLTLTSNVCWDTGIILPLQSCDWVIYARSMSLGQSRDVTYKDHLGMPYTDAVLLETLRIGNVLSTSLPHTLAKDLTVNGKVGFSSFIMYLGCKVDRQVFSYSSSVFHQYRIGPATLPKQGQAMSWLTSILPLPIYIGMFPPAGSGGSGTYGGNIFPSIFHVTLDGAKLNSDRCGYCWVADAVIGYIFYQLSPSDPKTKIMIVRRQRRRQWEVHNWDCMNES